jgi:mono/diheme cytochrome c family protein
MHVGGTGAAPRVRVLRGIREKAMRKNAMGAASALSGVLVASCMTVAALACGGKNEKPSNAGATAAAPGEAARTVGPMAGAPPAGATVAMVALGDSVFHGQAAGGTCFTCHGMDAKGTALAPSLADNQWLTGDGTYAFIQKRVTDGVPNPTPPYTAAMPPKGGANLTPDQIKAVAAYVFSISR